MLCPCFLRLHSIRNGKSSSSGCKSPKSASRVCSSIRENRMFKASSKFLATCLS
ncbi:hypothetical protein FAMCQIZV_CDS0039 [Phage C72C1]|nr:hypothetical protein FAMCQIZV_CDS0039 [Phage C72C1]